MRKSLTRHMSLPAFITVVLALFAVAAGSATAAALITSANIKDGTIQSRDLSDGAVTAAKLRPSTRASLRGDSRQTLSRLAALEAKAGIPGPAGTNGSNGANGATGTKGDKGDNGNTGATGPAGPTGPTGAKGDPATTQVSGPGNGFEASNPSVRFTGTGVTFGPYTNNTAGDQTSGGTLRFKGPQVAGKRLGDLARVEYTATGTFADNGDAPYLRVFIDNDRNGVVDHDVVFSPSTQPGACAGLGGGATSAQCNTSGQSVRYVVQDGTVRYDDDAGSGPDSSFDSIIAAHKDDVIMGVYVSTGNSQPGTTGGRLNSLLLELDGSAPREYAFGG